MKMSIFDPRVKQRLLECTVLMHWLCRHYHPDRVYRIMDRADNLYKIFYEPLVSEPWREPTEYNVLYHGIVTIEMDDQNDTRDPACNLDIVFWYSKSKWKEVNCG